MNQYENKTVTWLMDNIDEGNIAVPSVQRSFVWREDKICSLFDSLTLGYPIGTLLFWLVKGDAIKENYLTEFVAVLDQNRNLLRGEHVTDEKREFKAVLDGQQRITALRIGICGSLRLRKKKYAKTFIEKKLCINILHDPNSSDDEVGYRYEYSFTDPKEAEQFELNEKKQPNLQSTFWVPVGVVFDKTFRTSNYVREIEKKYDPDPNIGLPATVRCLIEDTLDNLANALKKDTNINFFMAEDYTKQAIVDIFERVNTGGTTLSASDLMLSLASGGAVDDAQIAIEAAAETIQEASSCGLEVNKDLILRAGLLFADRENVSLRSTENYSKECINLIFDTHWENITTYLSMSISLLEEFGFNSKKMPKNVLLVVAYYLFFKKKKSSFIASKELPDLKNKRLIQQFALRAMLNSLFSDATGKTLVSVRNLIRESEGEFFPLDEFLDPGLPRTLYISSKDIKAIFDLEYKNDVVQPLLAMLAGRMETKNYHKDHMWAKAILLNEDKLTAIFPSASKNDRKSLMKIANNILNIELIDDGENKEKRAKTYSSWATNYKKGTPEDYAAYQKRNMIDPSASVEIVDYKAFYDARKAVIAKRAKVIFKNSAEEIMAAYSEEDSQDTTSN